MATFTELCNDVYTITNRPELIDETKLAVKAATLTLHHTDFYYRDLLDSSIQFTSSEYVQQFDIKNLFPRFRALKYIRRFDNSGSGTTAELYKILTPTEVIDSYGNNRMGVAYVAGTMVNIKSSNLLQYAIIGMYLNPDITETGFTSWIATDHPYAIVYEAARLVFKQTGFDEQAAAFDKMVAEQVAEIRMSNIQAEGY
jgi:hypothetical protein